MLSQEAREFEPGKAQYSTPKFLILGYWNPKSRQGPGLGGLSCRGGPEFIRKLNIDRIAAQPHIWTLNCPKLQQIVLRIVCYPNLRLNSLIAYNMNTFLRILLKLQYNCWERLLISNDISFYLFTDNEVFNLITCCAGSCFTAIWRSYTISAGNNNSH